MMQILNYLFNDSMIHVQTRITQGLDLLQFFTMRQWEFTSDNFQSVAKMLANEEEQKMLV